MELQMEMAVERCNLKGDTLRTRLENQVDRQVIDDIRDQISKVLGLDRTAPTTTDHVVVEASEAFTSAPHSF